jgi:Tat protein secretion system quality control protein TatD with DNase activity
MPGGSWATVGIHPHEADLHPDTDAATLIDAAGHDRVIGIGETSLDYFYDKEPRPATSELPRPYPGCTRHRPAAVVHPRRRSRYAGVAAEQGRMC